MLVCLSLGLNRTTWPASPLRICCSGPGQPCRPAAACLVQRVRAVISHASAALPIAWAVYARWLALAMRCLLRPQSCSINCNVCVSMRLCRASHVATGLRDAVHDRERALWWCGVGGRCGAGQARFALGRLAQRRVSCLIRCCRCLCLLRRVSASPPTLCLNLADQCVLCDACSAVKWDALMGEIKKGIQPRPTVSPLECLTARGSVLPAVPSAALLCFGLACLAALAARSVGCLAFA
jgi:hypothetical protein